MKQYFINLFNEIQKQDKENKYIFFYSEQNIEELRKLNNGIWEKNGILLKCQEEVVHHLSRMDLYFCPLSVLWPRPLPLPMVVTLPDIQEMFYPQFFSESDLYSRAYHYRGSTQIADRVITISHFSKETIIRNHRISPKKVVVAYPCIDQIFFRANKLSAEKNIPLPYNEFILYPANRWLHKNHDGLLRAIKYLKGEKKVTINVILTGQEMVQGFPLVSKIEEYGLSNQIFLAGYLSKEALAGLYARAKMVIFPSLFEGFGLPLVEAMAVGCPVAASQTTSLPEIGGEAVEYFDPHRPEAIAQTIEYLWNNPEKRKDLIEKGFKRIKRFSAANLIQSHLEAFEGASQAFSVRCYYWKKFWVHPIHRWQVHQRYRDMFEE